MENVLKRKPKLNYAFVGQAFNLYCPKLFDWTVSMTLKFFHWIYTSDNKIIFLVVPVELCYYLLR